MWNSDSGSEKTIPFGKLLLMSLTVICLVGIILRGLFIIIRVPSESMWPTLEEGTRLLGTRRPDTITRGNILVFRHDGIIFIKRVVGLSGESITISIDGMVAVNGVPLAEPYVSSQRTGKEMFFNVPPGYLLFLGDNRNHSYDARYWEEPYVPVSDVIAIAQISIYPNISYIEQENPMSKKAWMGLAAAALIAVLLLANHILINRGDPPEPVPETIQPATEESTPAEQQDGTLPNFVRGEDRPYLTDALNTEEQSPTVLTDQDIMEAVAGGLEKLQFLSSDCMEHISPYTVDGKANPFYYMIAAAMGHETSREIWQKAGQRSRFEVVGIEPLGINNTYAVSVQCETPYLAGLLNTVNKSGVSYYEQEYTGFVSSGAASGLLEIDIAGVPVISDKVDLYVVVENDIPILFYSASTNHGGNIPQYAFLWGGYQFYGLDDGDLLFPNTLGGFSNVERAVIEDSIPDSIYRLEFVEQVVDQIGQGALDSAMSTPHNGDTLMDSFVHGRAVRSLQYSVNEVEQLKESVIGNLRTCSVVLRYYHCPAAEGADYGDAYGLELVYYPAAGTGNGIAGYMDTAVRHLDEGDDVIQEDIVDMLAGLLVRAAGY